MSAYLGQSRTLPSDDSPAPDRSPAPIRPLGVLALAFIILFIDGYDLFTLGTVGPTLLWDGAWGMHITAGTLGMLGSVRAPERGGQAVLGGVGSADGVGLAFGHLEDGDRSEDLGWTSGAAGSSTSTRLGRR